MSALADLRGFAPNRRAARQPETASHMNEWLSSPGLQTPT